MGDEFFGRPTLSSEIHRKFPSPGVEHTLTTPQQRQLTVTVAKCQGNEQSNVLLACVAVGRTAANSNIHYVKTLYFYDLWYTR